MNSVTTTMQPALPSLPGVSSKPEPTNPEQIAPSTIGPRPMAPSGASRNLIESRFLNESNVMPGTLTYSAVYFFFTMLVLPGSVSTAPVTWPEESCWNSMVKVL